MTPRLPKRGRREFNDPKHAAKNHIGKVKAWYDLKEVKTHGAFQSGSNRSLPFIDLCKTETIHTK